MHTGLSNISRLVATTVTAIGFSLFAVAASAAVVRFDLAGGTDNTFVGSGNPCSTGLSGANACNSQAMTVVLFIDTSNTGTDGYPADPADGYYGALSEPGFITGSATINGNAFNIPSTFQFNFAQNVEIRDNYFGVDQVIIGVSGGNATESFSLGPTINLTGDPFSGDSLAVLTQLQGTLSLFNSAFSTFNFTGATGQVQGNVVFSQVSVSTVPAPPAGLLLATGVAGLLGRRYRR